MIEKIFNLLAKIPADKLLHSYIVLIIGVATYDVFELFLSMWWSVLAAAIVSTTGIIWKEIYDSKHNCTHNVEFMDIVAGYIGLIIGLLLKIL